MSKVLPLFARRTKEIGDLLPELYFHGLAEGDFDLALRGLLGENAPLSASTVARLKEKWQAECNGWKSRDLKGLQVVYLWADGLYVKAGLAKEKAALLTVIAGLSDGRKEILHLESGYRESKESWAGVLRDLRKRGIEEVSLVVADGHLGIWAALPEVYPEAREQRCWNHKVVNVLDRIPTKKQIETKMMVAAIPYCVTREQAEKGKSKFELWCKSNGLDKAAEILNTDWERMMTFYSFPKGERHSGHLEDDAGRREAVPKTKCTRIVTGGISGCHFLESLRRVGSQPHRGKGRLHDVGCADVLPMLLWNLSMALPSQKRRGLSPKILLHTS